MQISKPEVSCTSQEVTYQVRVDWSQGTKTLWYKVDRRFGDMVCDSADAAVVGLLIPAMAAGEDLHVAGSLSEQLHFHIAGPYQHLLELVIPSLRRVRVIPTDLHRESIRGSGVATGFSGGVDSYCALADYFYTRTPPDFRITHLLFNNVGSHGPGGERLFLERYERLQPPADRIGLPFLKVNSNLSEFYAPQPNFMLTHTPRNASVPLLLQNGIGRSLVASTYHFRDLFIGPTDCMAYSDTTALPMLGTERIVFTAVGTEYTRVEKTVRVAQLPQTYESLDVCTSPLRAGNCSACQKCLRTLLTLEISGELHRYAAVFDLDVYRQHRAEFMATVAASERVLLRELARYADRSGFSLRAA